MSLLSLLDYPLLLLPPASLPFLRLLLLPNVVLASVLALRFLLPLLLLLLVLQP